MRSELLLFPILIAACTSTTLGPFDAEPSSLRERLATKTHLLVIPNDGAGVVTARHRTRTGWSQSLVNLAVDRGGLIANTDRSGNLALGALEFGFQPVTIPPSLFGREAQLTNLHLQLVEPTRVMTTWNGDDDAQVTAPLGFELSWSLVINDTQVPLGAPRLPPIPVRLQLTGDDSRIAAEVRVHAPGELWNWADLLTLSDFDLTLGAQAPIETGPVRPL
ncbi:MAG TPA: hypothetical protein VHN14_36015 [Kofleriaceae bacterium]|jgi:hypothetical protein|nr:hypothetical protein [Kofleriaceae bacterium]